MSKVKSLFGDLFAVLFSPKSFFKERFMAIESKWIFACGFIGIFFGVLIGSALMVGFSEAIIRDFLSNKEPYVTAIKSLGLTEEGFSKLIELQRAYCLLLLVMSPVLAYVIPHLFGGALFFFLWSLLRGTNSKFTHAGVMNTAAISLTSVAFYALPVIGPFIAAIMVFVNSSRALFVQYQISGFVKAICILLSMYVCFFLVTTTLQVMAMPLAEILKSSLSNGALKNLAPR
jgi:predicted lysophospholipase L1 biosynthesis ABC-type transport system permease subunit